MNLPILDLKQNTPEWHQWRAQGLGASEIAALYGKHPYLTEYQLWLQKTGQAEGFKGNVATEHGQREEPHAFHALKTVCNLLQDLQAGCLEHAKHPHLRCSMDAYSLHKVLNLEIEKNIADEIHIFEIKSPFGEKNRGIIECHQLPEYWIYQCQMQQAIARSYGIDIISFIYLWLGTKEKSKIFGVESDLALQDDMIQKANHWWQHHVVMGNPVPPDTIYLSQEGIKNKLSLYEEYQHTAKQIDAQKRALKCEIEAFLDGCSNYHTDTHQIIRTAPRTSYDFQAMRRDGIDLSKYRIQNGSEGSYIIKLKKKENA